MTSAHRLAIRVAALAGLAAALPAPTVARAGEFAGGAVVPAPPYDLEELIRLAIQRDPELIELRGEVEIATAEARAVKDWEDPEIRIRYREDNDVELPRPISETRTSTERQSGSSVTDNSRLRDGGRTESSRESESFDETTTTTTTREITPGATGDRIVESTRESTTGSSRTSESGAERTAGGISAPFSESRSESTRENVTSRTVEDRSYDFNRLDPDSDFAARIRFRLPHPFERRQLVRRAQTRITMAESLLRAAEHAVAIDVRRAYADLLEVNGEIRSLRHLAEVRTKLADEVESNPRATLEDTVAFADDAFRTELELIPLSAELDQRAADVAALVGIQDASQISLDSPIAPRRVDLDGLDAEFLYGVANAYRADIVELIHRASMSELELKAHNAKKIPWLNFVDGFYGVDYDRGYRSSDAFGFQVGISLPLFSWFKNHEHEIYERERDSYRAQAAAVGNRIRSEVDLALARLQRASGSLAEYESAYGEYRDKIAGKLEEAMTAGVRGAESRYRAEEALARLGERRYLALSLYNDAVLTLEAALGTTLDDVFTPSPDDPPAAGGAGTPAPGSSSASQPAALDPTPSPAQAAGDDAAPRPRERLHPRGAPHRR